ncbi:MAG: DUF456 domain-containing protein [Bacteroidia bacterium]|nr:DUF456 domain-containing protein [Bacteroidia bacterium]
MEITLIVILIISGALLNIVGFVGSVIPALPGPPFNYASLLLLHLFNIHHYSTPILVILGIVTAIVLTLDYVVPMYGAKKTGGSKYGIWGTAIGLVAGLFLFPPFGIIIGPFAGAVIGELIGGKESKDAFRAGFGAFLGFIAGSFSKLIVASIILGFFIYGAIQQVA